MQKQKGVSTLTGIIIIVAVAIVAFGGVLAWQYFSKSNPPAGGPMTNIQPNLNAQNQNETMGWKTYINTQYGFELKYPQDWGYGINNYDNQQLINFFKGTYKGEGDGILTISWNTTLQERYTGIKSLFSNYNVEESVISFAGINGKLLTISNTSGFSRDLLFEKNGYVYNFAMTSGNESIFDQMLSTFKFTK